MKSASKPTKPLTWGQIYKGAERLDERHGTEAYTNAVLMKMLEHVCEKKSAPKKVYFLVRRPRAPLTPLQAKMARRREMAYR